MCGSGAFYIPFCSVFSAKRVLGTPKSARAVKGPALPSALPGAKMEPFSRFGGYPMKKRLLSLLCVLVLTVSVIPAASALEGEAAPGRGHPLHPGTDRLYI